MSDSDNDKKEKHVRLTDPADISKLKIERLMQRIDKPIVLPESRRNKEDRGPKPPVDFVRNVQGSSAGAGSGEFHVYRALRRKEMARLKAMDAKDRREKETQEYHEKIQVARQAEEEKTAKKREKRKRRNKGGKDKNKKQKGGEKESANDDADDEDGDEDKEEEEEGETETVKTVSASGLDDTNLHAETARDQAKPDDKEKGENE
ncbi:hypothetical protein BC830DRAFT_1257435 [Chytriomyces sp. MP71]|nr:hypothetical protein BC830DRAFT_1257435 [Chytriomyces sp. MP71]